jgi:hypothetical protein
VSKGERTVPYESKELGAAGHVLRYRLRFHQRTTNKSFTTLARIVRELGHPMSAARIGEAFNGYRRVATDELTALATALEVPSGSLTLDQSPAANTALVEEIAELETNDLRLRSARADFAVGPLEALLDRGALLGQRERRDADVPDPEETLRRLESILIEIELLDAEKRRRGIGEESDGER